MSFLFDFGAIKTGGGLQLASSFLRLFKASEVASREISVLASERLAPLAKSGWDVVGVVPNRMFSRVLFEYFWLPRIIKKENIKAIYTFFGPGLPKISGVKSVVSVAYPIICYPDSNYWRHLPWLERLKKRLINSARAARIRRADVVVCETEVMKARLKEFCGIRAEIVVLPPSPTEFLSEFDPKLRVLKRNACCRILVLGGLAHHKNNWRLYQVARVLNQRKISAIFVCSFDAEDFGRAIKMTENSSVDREIFNKYFEFLGTLPPEGVESAYQGCQFLINLSDLESFSNNYMEAWKASVILLCSDRDFSRHICGESALYFEPHDVDSVVDAILKATSLSVDSAGRMLNEGKRRLRDLPLARERMEKIIRLLESDY